jgi:hypothetical protein
VLDRTPEGLDGLAGQRSPALVDDRHRDPQRQVRGHLTCGGDRGLRVERVEDRLDQQQVDPAIGERLDLLRVRGADVVEGDRPIRRVLDAWGQRQGDVERPDRAGDETSTRLVRGLAGETRALQVHFPHVRLQPVVGLADARGGERVGRGDVRARGEVLPVHVEDDVGPREVEQVGIAGHVTRVVLEAVTAVVGGGEPGALQHGAPRTVEHHDPLVEEFPQGSRGVASGRPVHWSTSRDGRRPCGSNAGRAWRAHGPLQRLSA